MVDQIIGDFIKNHGRRPRVLICNFEPIENSLEHSNLAVQYASIGLDVDIAPFNLDVNHLFKQAIENDVHFVHFQLHSKENKKLIAGLKKALNKKKILNFLFVVSTENETHEIIKGNILYLPTRNNQLERSLPKILDALNLK